jgi:hypothetical protein
MAEASSARKAAGLAVRLAASKTKRRKNVERIDTKKETIWL